MTTETDMDMDIQRSPCRLSHPLATREIFPRFVREEGTELDGY
jgi:hypothetical protein